MDLPPNQSLQSPIQNDGDDERKQIAERLQFQATILRHVSDCVIVSDLQGIITYWNEGASAVFGYTAEEMLGKTPARLYPGRNVSQPVEDLEHLLAGFDYLGEWEGRRKDGTGVWVDIKTTVLRDMQGKAIGLIGVAKDITARKQAEERLRQSEKHFRALIENNADGIALTDGHGVITYASPSTTRMVGFLPEEFVGGRIFGRKDYPDGGEATRRLMARVLEEPRKSHVLELRTGHKDGSFLWIEVVGINLLDEPGVEAIVWNFRDITEQKELEQRKDHFISMASHELKTPLTILSAFTQLLRERFVAKNRQDAVLLLSKMDDQITNLTKLVVDLLDISRMQAGQFELAQQEVDMDELVREVVENLQPTTTHRLLIEGAAQQSVIGDRDRLGQVLIILLTNAIKYSPHADTVVVRVARTHHTHDTLTVSVEDFGIGIAQGHQQRLFERFYRVLSEKGQTYPGLGIGLYIAHEIIQRHGGKIWADSVEGKGSTFSFSLPMRE